LYLALYLPAFISYRWAPLLLVALAPFALAVCGARNGFAAIVLVTAASLVLWLFGNLFFAAYNFVAVIALALLHACILGLSGLALRLSYRVTRLPIALLLPITFVAGEFIRLLGPLGVPTGLLALPFHQRLWMIQIADLGGVYLVSFAVATISGALADVLLRTRWQRISPVMVGLLWLFIGGYGAYRLRESEQTLRAGPVIGVVQPDVPLTGGIEHGFDAQLFLKQMLALSDQAAAHQPPPQLIVWPEAMAAIPPLNSEWLKTNGVPEDQLVASRSFEQALRDWTNRRRIPLLVGSQSIVPDARTHEFAVYNSAIRFDPSRGQSPERQDKIRLFPIGENIPWRGSAIHNLIEHWIVPRSSVVSLGWYTRGETRNVFALPASAAGEQLHYTVSMCVELCYAENCGAFLRNARGSKAADFFVNMSNDGIFQRNRALVLHASMSSFRAVEARVGIARSANTGISGFVKPTGEMYGDVVNERGKAWTGLGAPELTRIAELVKFRHEHEAELASNAALAQHVTTEIAAIEQLRREAGVSGESVQPIYLDSRRTLYSRVGDAFAWTLVILTSAAFFLPVFSARKLV